MKKALIAVLVACTPTVASYPKGVLENFVYPESPLVAVRGAPVAPDVPTLSGSGARFTISPLLPPGLSIDGGNGTISGTPTAVAPTLVYVITASNDSGAISTSLSLRVAEAAPQLTFAGAPYTFVLNEASSTGAPANNGGAITGCACDALKALALTVDPYSCEVSGFPNALAALASYTLVIDYNDGTAAQTAQATVSIAVNPQLEISPSGASMFAIPGEQQTFTASGGHGPYAFSSTPANSIDSAGHFSSTASTGTTTVTVSDADGRTASAQVTSHRTWVNGPVHAVTGSNQAVFVGGQFTRAGFIAVPSILGVNATTAATDYGFNVQSGFDGPVNAIAVAGDAVYVGGTFAHYQGQAAKNLAKLSFATGALDTTFTHTVGAAGTGVFALAIVGNALYVGGDISAYRGIDSAPGIALDATSGALLTQFPPSHGNDVFRAVAATSDSVYFGGTQTALSVFSKSGTLQTTTGLPTGATTALVATGSSLFMGGTYGLAKVVAGQATAITNATIGASAIAALATDGSALYVGGLFPRGLVKLDLSGATTADAINGGAGFGGAPAGPAINENVSALLLSGSTLYVGGDFTTYNGQPVSAGIAAIDAVQGTTLAGFAARSGIRRADVTAKIGTNLGDTPTVSALALAGGDVLVGGALGTYQGVNCANLTKFVLNDSTFLASFAATARVAFTSGRTGIVNALAYGNGKLYVGGDFDSVGAANGPFAVLNSMDGIYAADAASNALDWGTEPIVNTIALTGDPFDTAWVGGDFIVEPDHNARELNIATTAISETITNHPQFNSTVTSIKPVGSTTSVDVVGNFQVYNCGGGTCSGQLEANGYARLDGSKLPANAIPNLSNDTPIGNNPVAVWTVGSIGTVPYDQLTLLGGPFTGVTLPGAPPAPTATRAGLLQLDADPAASASPLRTATPFAPMDPSFSGGSILALWGRALSDQSQVVYAGGNFAFVNGQQQKGLARLALPPPLPRDPLDPATAFYVDQAASATLAVGGAVYALEGLNGLLYVGGLFDTYQGQPAYNLIAIDQETGALQP